MTVIDTAEIRARHTFQFGGLGGRWCGYCGQVYPCDAIRLADALDADRAALQKLRSHILDISAHATPFSDIEDDPGYVAIYLLTAGALHRALGTIGHSAASCDAEAKVTEQTAEIDRLRVLPTRDEIAAVLEANRTTLITRYDDDGTYDGVSLAFLTAEEQADAILALLTERHQ